MGNSAISPAIFYDACQRGDLAQLETIFSHQKLTIAEKEKYFNHRVEEMPKMISTPLFIAIQNHHLPIVQLLLSNGLNPNTRLQTLVGNNETALMHAISWRDAMIVDVLLRYKAQVNAIDSVSGKTALHRACALRESALTHTSTVMDLVNTLSKYDADWTIADKNGNLPLHCACLVGNLPLIAQLLTSDKTRKTILQQLDSPNKMAKTPLMIACEHNHASLVSLLLQEGANPFLALAVRVEQSQNTHNLNSSSSKKGKSKSSYFSISSSSAPQEQPKKKRPHKKTALCWAVENNHEDIVRLLLAHHRDMFTTSNAKDEVMSTVDNHTGAVTAAALYPLNQLRNRSTKAQQLEDNATDAMTATSSSSFAQGHPTRNKDKHYPSASTGYGSDEDDGFFSDDDDEDDLLPIANGSAHPEQHVQYFAFHHITHLVGCCLLEAILLGEVAIAQMLLEHVHAYFQFHDDNNNHNHKNKNNLNIIDGSLRKMYNRAFMLACQARHRGMVQMLLRHIQAIGLPLETVLHPTTTTTTHTNFNHKYEQYEELFARAGQDAVIVSLIQGFVDGEAQ